jgi:hypothetical protein
MAGYERGKRKDERGQTDGQRRGGVGVSVVSVRRCVGGICDLTQAEPNGWRSGSAGMQSSTLEAE